MRPRASGHCFVPQTYMLTRRNGHSCPCAGRRSRAALSAPAAQECRGDQGRGAGDRTGDDGERLGVPLDGVVGKRLRLHLRLVHERLGHLGGVVGEGHGGLPGRGEEPGRLVGELVGRGDRGLLGAGQLVLGAEAVGEGVDGFGEVGARLRDLGLDLGRGALRSLGVGHLWIPFLAASTSIMMPVFGSTWNCLEASSIFLPTRASTPAISRSTKPTMRAAAHSGRASAMPHTAASSRMPKAYRASTPAAPNMPAPAPSRVNLDWRFAWASSSSPRISRENWSVTLATRSPMLFGAFVSRLGGAPFSCSLTQIHSFGVREHGHLTSSPLARLFASAVAGNT